MSSNYIIKQSDNVAEILLYGNIDACQNPDSNNFITAFKKAEATHPQINVRINSGGGDVFSGISIYNTLKNSTAEIHIYIDGVAASMASVIALAGSKIFMSRYAQLMIHRISGTVYGDSEKLRENANLMDDMGKNLLDIYASRTGQDIETIQSTWMQRGKDSWFNATEAIKYKLVDEVFDGVIKRAPKKNSDPQAVWQFYNLQIENSLNNNDMQILNQFKSVFSLPENATEQDVLAAFQNQLNKSRELTDENEKLKKQNTEFQNQLQETQKQKVKDLVDAAIKSNRITEDHRLTYVALAESNYDATKVALNAITPYKSIASQISATSEEEPEYKTFREYQEKAPEQLKEMQTANPAKYANLYKKQFGKAPKPIAF